MTYLEEIFLSYIIISNRFLSVNNFLESMKNGVLAKLLFDIAELLELQNVPFKPRAYQNAARVIESLSDDIEDVWKAGKLTELPSVDQGIAERIDEFLKTGKIKYYDELKKKLPMDVEQLSRVQGLGPKRIKLLYEQLKIKTLDDLQKAAEAHKIQKIKGLRLEKHSAVGRVEIAGSYRRKRETIGDIDILVTSSKPKEVMEFVTSMSEVADVLARGETKTSVVLSGGIQVDVRVVKEKEFGSALQYFTGNKEHNVKLRQIALKKGLTLNEYGLFTLKNKMWVAGKTEDDIYKKLGIDVMPAELRENMCELEFGAKHKLPKLIGYGAAQGDFQTHTTWSDGTESIKAMAVAAQKLGWAFITITDHVGQIGVANPLDERRLGQQAKEIAKLNDNMKIRIFHGAEVDILKSGELALSKTWQKIGRASCRERG